MADAPRAVWINYTDGPAPSRVGPADPVSGLRPIVRTTAKGTEAIGALSPRALELVRLSRD